MYHTSQNEIQAELNDIQEHDLLSKVSIHYCRFIRIKITWEKGTQTEYAT